MITVQIIALIGGFILLKRVLDEEFEDDWDWRTLDWDDIPLCSEKHKKKGFIPGFTDDYWEERTGVTKVKGGIVTGNFTHLLRPGLTEDFSFIRAVILTEGEFYHSPIWFDHSNETIYDETYWKAWKDKNKHEEDKG